MTMQLKSLFTGEERAVSPVIGVILMVAITVILAAVIGTFVLGLGDQVQTTAPNAQFTFDQDGDADGATNVDVTITHEGGDSIESDRLTISSNTLGETTFTDDPVSAGSSETVTAQFEDDETVRVIWESDDGGDSQVLAEYEVN